jgi:hypothetical protein
VRPETVRRVVEQLRAKAASTTFPAERTSFLAKAEHLEAKYDLAPPRRAPGPGFARAGSSWANRVDEAANRIRQDNERLRREERFPNFDFDSGGIRFTTTHTGPPPQPDPGRTADQAAAERLRQMRQVAQERRERQERANAQRLIDDLIRTVEGTPPGQGATTTQTNAAWGRSMPWQGPSVVRFDGQGVVINGQGIVVTGRTADGLFVTFSWGGM